jgi:hypothetical protein
MDQAIQVRKKLHALLLVGVGPGHDSPGPFGVAGVGVDVRNVGRDVEEIPLSGRSLIGIRRHLEQPMW